MKRFARDTVFHLKLRSALKVREARPECLNYSFDDSPEGEFAETIFAAQGQLERKQNARQVIQKQRARLELGYCPFFPPIGYEQKKYQLHGKVLVPKNPEANILKEALEGFANNRFENQIDVRNFLEAMNFFNGKPIYLTAVKRLLVKPIYAGIVQHKPWDVSPRAGRHEALITVETFQKIQDKLNGKAKIRTRRDQRSDFPLRGFVVCAGCGQQLTSSWSKGSIKNMLIIVVRVNLV